MLRTGREKGAELFTPLHRSLGIEPGDLTWDLIDQAVREGVQEEDDLDWKTDAYSTQTPKWQDEAAKDIAAMANSGGGWIVFGVKEDGRNRASKIRPVAWDADTRQRLLNVAYARIGPPVLGLEFFPIPCEEDSYVVLMHIPDSLDAPHFARKGEDAFIAPRRNGPHTVFMSDREIERGFRERFQRASERERQLHTAFEHAAQGLNPAQGVCLVIAALPISSIRAAPMTENAAYQFVHPTVPPGLLQPRATTPYASGAAVVRKGLRQWRIHSSQGSIFPYRKSLHDDGAVLAGYRLGALTDDERGAQSYPVGQPNHCRSVDVETAIVDFMATLRDYATERQINSSYRVRAGLMGNPDEPIYIRTTDPRLQDLLNPEDAVEPIHHFQPVTIDLDPLAMVDSFLPDLNQLARDIVNQGGVLRLQRISGPQELP